MCTTPTKILNPYYRVDPKKGLNFLHDCTSQYIYTPCGHCSQCIATKQMYMIQRFQMQSLDSYVYFSTLTYDDMHLPLMDVGDFSLRFAYFKHFTDMVKRIRRNNMFGRPFSYFAVSERGTKRARPHFHCLWFIPKYSEDNLMFPYNLEKHVYDVVFNQWAVNVGSRKFPVYEKLFTYQARVYNGVIHSNFDTHFVTPRYGYSGSESVAWYVQKYLLKLNTHDRKLQQALRLNLSDEEYNSVWPVLRSHAQVSKGFGLGFNLDNPDDPSSSVLDYIRDCVRKTPDGSPYPCFFSPSDGSSQPLAPYYQSRSDFYTLNDALRIHEHKDSLYNDLPDDYYNKYLASFERFQKHLRMSDFNNNSLLID